MISTRPSAPNTAGNSVCLPPDAPHIRYFGRWDTTDSDNYRCAQGAVYIRLNFTGAGIKARLLDEANYWKVSIDGGPFRKFRPAGCITSLAEELPSGSHRLLLVRMTEGLCGTSCFQGFILDSGASSLTPDAPKGRCLEFVGDSITAGAKNSPAPSPSQPDYYDMEDSDMAYGPQLARMLNADYSVLGVSGEGFIHNWDEIKPYNRVHTADRYKWILYSDVCRRELLWNPEQFPADAVILCTGTNDFIDRKPGFPATDYINPDGSSRIPQKDDFIKGYTKLVRSIRCINPHAAIICLEPPPAWAGREPHLWIDNSVSRLRAKGDKNLHYIPLNVPTPLLTADDYAGDLTHPTAGGAKKIALYLKDKVAAIMRWQSPAAYLSSTRQFMPSANRVSGSL